MATVATARQRRQLARRLLSSSLTNLKLHLHLSPLCVRRVVVAQGPNGRNTWQLTDVTSGSHLNCVPKARLECRVGSGVLRVVSIAQVQHLSF